MADMKKMLAELLARQDESLDLSYESRKAVVDEFREAIAADVVAKRMIGKQRASPQLEHVRTLRLLCMPFRLLKYSILHFV